jgi:sirohydrochlorin ferrochelatase
VTGHHERLRRARNERGTASDEHSPTLVAVAHGSRRPAAQEDVRRLLDAVRAARPGLDVREAYIELAEPLLPQVLGSLTAPAVVVPLLLGHGYHIAHDVAGMAAAHSRAETYNNHAQTWQGNPGLPCAPALGPDPLLIEALADRLAQAEYDVSSDRFGPVVLAAAGSSDRRSHADAEATARLLAARLGRPVVPAYNTAARSSVRETVAGLRRAGHRRVGVATYLLWPGRFAAEVAACGADFVAAPIGVHPALAQLVLDRYDAARRAQPLAARSRGSVLARR